MNSLKTVLEFEFGRNFQNKWTIKKSHLKFLKNCEIDLIDGYYDRKIFSITEFENSELIKKLNTKKIKTSEFLNDCFISLNLISHSIKENDIINFKQFIVKPYHIKLLNSLYFSNGPYEEFFDNFDSELFDGINYGWVIQTADKRPFGNSFVEFDILEAMNKTITHSNIKKAKEVYIEVLELLIHILKYENIQYYSFKFDKKTNSWKSNI